MHSHSQQSIQAQFIRPIRLLLAITTFLCILTLNGCKSDSPPVIRKQTSINSIKTGKKASSDSPTTSPSQIKIKPPTISTISDTQQTTYSALFPHSRNTRIHGKITLNDTTPIRNGRLTFAVYKTWYYKEAGTTLYAETALAKDGRYALDVHSNHSYEITISGENITTGKISLYKDAGKIRKISNKQYEFDREFDYALPAITTLTGQVFGINNSPLSDAQVSFTHTDRFDEFKYDFKPAFPTTKTDSQGNFRLTGIFHGTGEVLAYHPNYLPAVVRDVTLPTSSSVTIPLKEGGGTLSGSVVSLSENFPISNADIKFVMVPGQLDFLGYKPYFENLAVRSDSSGSFTVKNLPPVEFKVFSETKSPVMKELAWDKDNKSIFKLKDNETTDTQLRLYPGHTISGRVFDKESQEPLADVTLSTNEITSATKSDSTGTYIISSIFTDTIITPWLPGYKQYTENNSVSTKNPYDLNIEMDIPMIKTIKVSGIVKSVDDIPIADAKIYYGTTAGQATGQQWVTSDKSGKYALETIPFSELYIVATAEGFSSKQEKTIETSIDDITNHNIILERGITVSGQILSQDGIPAGGTTIFTGQNIFFHNGSTSLSTERVTADPLGNFTIGNLSSKSGFGFSHPEYGSSRGEISSLKLYPGDVYNGFIVHLKPENKLAGIIKTKSGKAASGIWISVDLPDGSNTGNYSDENGRFEVTSDTTGTCVIRSWEKEFDKVHAPMGKQDVLLILNNEPKELKSSNELGNVLLTVNVVDKKTQKPVPDFKFTMNPIAGSPVLDKENPGVLIVKQLMEGKTYDLTLAAPGYMENILKIEVPTDADSVKKVVEMESGGSVTGIVQDKKTGEPLSNVVVQNLGNDIKEGGFEEGTRPLSYVVTDSTGKFTLSPVAEGKMTIKIVGAASYIPQSKKVDVQNAQNTDMGIIRLHEGSKIKGKVKINSSVPDNRTIQLRPKGKNFFLYEKIKEDETYEFKQLEAGEYILIYKGEMIDITLGENEEKEVNMEGGYITLIVEFDKREDQQPYKIYFVNKQTKITRYADLDSTNKIENLSPGIYTYNVTDLRTRKDLVSGEITIPDDEPEFRYTFVLNKGRIKGKLQTSQGKPVSGADIKLITAPDSPSSGKPSNVQPTESVQDGTFEFDNIPNGTYSVSAQKTDMGFTSKDNIKVGQSEINIVLTLPEKGGDIESLAIHAETGEPIRGASVTLTDGTRRYSYNHKRDTNGIMKIRNIPPGKYSVEVRAANYTDSNHEIKVESEKTAVIEDALYPAGSLTWKLLTKDGEPAHGVSVVISNPNPKSERDNRTSNTNEEGIIRETGLSLGTYILTATIDDKTVSEEFFLRDEETVEKETRFPPSR